MVSACFLNLLLYWSFNCCVNLALKDFLLLLLLRIKSFLLVSHWKTHVVTGSTDSIVTEVRSWVPWLDHRRWTFESLFDSELIYAAKYRLYSALFCGHSGFSISGRNGKRRSSHSQLVWTQSCRRQAPLVGAVQLSKLRGNSVKEPWAGQTTGDRRRSSQRCWMIQRLA